MNSNRRPSDVTDVTQLVLHERRSRDRGWWDAQRECFAPDSTVRVSWFRGTGADFVTESEKLAANGEDATHSVGPPVVDVHRDRALAEVPCHMDLHTLLDDTPVTLSCHARLLYRAERRADRWLVSSLDAVYQRDALISRVPGTQLNLDEKKLAVFRPSYRMLAYLLGSVRTASRKTCTVTTSRSTWPSCIAPPGAGCGPERGRCRTQKPRGAPGESARRGPIRAPLPEVFREVDPAESASGNAARHLVARSHHIARSQRQERERCAAARTEPLAPASASVGGLPEARAGTPGRA